MNTRSLPPIPFGAPRRPFAVFAVCLLAALALPAAVAAAPWMWDQDEDGVDDRIETVALLGIDWAYENGDPEGRLRFEAQFVQPVLSYGAYVRFDHQPGSPDSLSLALAGAQVITVFRSVPYVRVRASYPSLVLIAGEPTVERVEAVSLMYSTNLVAGHAMAVRRGKANPGYSAEEQAGLTGAGIVVAILDTGINDAPYGAYPGHVDLQGKVAGGAYYGSSGPTGYTPWSSSVNPEQGVLGGASYHATHVGASIAGASRDRAPGGIAPGATLVDVKVLSDEGIGYGLAEGIEWCIQNRSRAWGGGATGIHVLNLSLSGTDPSDGNDCVSALVDAAANFGIVVVAAAGNDGACGALSAPASADGAVAVAAFNPRTGALAAFSNEGPRPDDLDLGHADEMKPDVAAPGVRVLSAFGIPVGDGRSYVEASGTSMATALVTGVVALLREADPGATPPEIRDLLRDTATHRSAGTLGCGLGPDPYGLDARYHPGWGWGEVDALAAWLEVSAPDRAQVVRLSAAWLAATSEVEVAWTTQREVNLTGFRVERASDAGGAPGTFTSITPVPVPAVGYADLADGNRTTYAWLDPAAAGARFWYRVVATGGTVETASAPVTVVTEDPAATIALSFIHNAPETDLDMRFGSGPSLGAPDWFEDLDLLGAVDSLTVPSAPGNTEATRYDVSLPVFGDGAPYLPPTPEQPWWLSAFEGGDPGWTASFVDFRMQIGPVVHVTETPLPASAAENSTTLLWIPIPSASGIPGDRGVAPPALRAYPNPFRSSVRLVFSAPADALARVTVHDAAGRALREWTARGEVAWDGRDGRGIAAHAGVYFVRVETAAGRSVASVTLLPH